MADVRVRAKGRGQKPDRTWSVEGEEFTVPEAMFSKRWMERVGSTVIGREATIKEALVDVPSAEFTASGKPEVDAVNARLPDLDPPVTAAERDKLWAELAAD